MGFRTEKFITKAMVRAAPDTLFVFGDNMKGTGRGGQAFAMRGEPNTVGIPTKWAPSMSDGAFFSDSDLPAVHGRIDARFLKLVTHLRNGGDVVWPEDEIGSGRAELRVRAPKIWGYIMTHRAVLVASNCLKVDTTKPNSG